MQWFGLVAPTQELPPDPGLQINILQVAWGAKKKREREKTITK